MTETLVYIGRHTIKPGMLETAKTRTAELVEHLREHHPRVLHFGAYFELEPDALIIVQVHPDEDSLQLHMQVAGERIAAAYEFLDATTGITIYGNPSEAFVARLQQMSRQGSEAGVRFLPEFAGLTRSSAAV